MMGDGRESRRSPGVDVAPKSNDTSVARIFLSCLCFLRRIRPIERD